MEGGRGEGEAGGPGMAGLVGDMGVRTSAGKIISNPGHKAESGQAPRAPPHAA